MRYSPPETKRAIAALVCSTFALPVIILQWGNPIKQDSSTSTFASRSDVGVSGRARSSKRRTPEPRHGGKLLPAPNAFGIFPDDLLLLPRTLVEKHANLARWTFMPVGGHFAPVEQPRLLSDDVQAFFGEQLAHAHDASTVRGAS